MANDGLKRLSDSAQAWTATLNELVGSQEISVGDLQRRCNETEREVSNLRDHLISAERSEKILKSFEIAAAFASLIVAVIIGVITLKLSDKANNIQESLANISRAQTALAVSGNNRTSADQLLDVLKETKLAGADPSEQERLLNKALNHIEGIPKLTMAEYKSLMDYVLNRADTQTSKIFWSYHPSCVNCDFDGRAVLLGIEIDYLNKITDKDEAYHDSRLEADSELTLLRKLAKTDSEQSQYNAISKRFGTLAPAKAQSIKVSDDGKRSLGTTGGLPAKTDTTAPPSGSTKAD